MKRTIKCLIVLFMIAMAFVVTGVTAEAVEISMHNIEKVGTTNITIPSAYGITITQTNATDKSVTASWNALAGVSGYLVYYGPSTSAARYITETTSTSVTINLFEGEYDSGRNAIIVLPYVTVGSDSYYNSSNYRYAYMYPAPQKVVKSEVTYWNSTSKKIDGKKYKGKISMTNTGYPNGYAVTVYNLSNKKIKTYTVNGSSIYSIVSAEFNIKTSKLKKCWNKGLKYEVKPYKIINGKKYYGPSTGKKVFIPQATVTKISSKKITWKKVSGAKGYYIYLSKDYGESFERVKKVSSKTTSATIKGFESGSKYQVYVIPYGVKVGKKKYKGTATTTTYYTTKYR